MQSISRINNALEWASCDKNNASKVKLVAYDGAWPTEYIGTCTIFMIISQILMEFGEYRILPNKHSLRVDRHPGEYRGSRRIFYGFFSYFCSCWPIFAYFEGNMPSELLGHVYSGRHVYLAKYGISSQWHLSDFNMHLQVSVCMSIVKRKIEKVPFPATAWFHWVGQCIFHVKSHLSSNRVA